jgi:hypothetical protein
VFSIFQWYSSCLHGNMKCNNFHLKILCLFSLRWWNVNVNISLIQIVFPSCCPHFMKQVGCSLIFLFIMPLCDTSHILDDYEHYFISCKSLDSFWNDVKILLEKLRIGIHILALKTLVFEYKIEDTVYNSITYFLAILLFTIYKSHYVSKQTENHINVFKFFKIELKNGFDLDKLA